MTAHCLGVAGIGCVSPGAAVRRDDGPRPGFDVVHMFEPLSAPQGEPGNTHRSALLWRQPTRTVAGKRSALSLWMDRQHRVDHDHQPNQARQPPGSREQPQRSEQQQQRDHQSTTSGPPRQTKNRQLAEQPKHREPNNPCARTNLNTQDTETAESRNTSVRKSED